MQPRPTQSGVGLTAGCIQDQGVVEISQCSAEIIAFKTLPAPCGEFAGSGGIGGSCRCIIAPAASGQDDGQGKDQNQYVGYFQNLLRKADGDL